MEPSAPEAVARVAKGGRMRQRVEGGSWSAARPREGWVLDLKQEHPAGRGVPSATLRNRGSKRWTWVGVNPGGSLAQKRADAGGHVGGATRGDARDGSLAGPRGGCGWRGRDAAVFVWAGAGVSEGWAERSQWWPSATTRPNVRGWKGRPPWDRRGVLGAGSPGSPRAGRLP